MPNNTDKKAVKGFTLLKMGVLEILFVGVVLFLFFGVLNYFNILSVSSAFPEQLGWLPRQTTQTNLPKNPFLQTNSSLQNALPTLTTVEAKQEKSFTILSENLKSNLIPSRKDLTNLFSTPSDNNLTFQWKQNNISLMTSIVLSANNLTSSFSIDVSLPSTQNSSDFSSESAKAIANTLFNLSDNINFKCKEKIADNITSKKCSAFWQKDKNLKQGIVVFPDVRIESNPSIDVITMCLYYKESGPLFESNECIVR